MAGIDDAKAYMSKREIPQLFESLMTALMYQKPEDHIGFLGDCLSKAKKEPKINWHTFIEPLPPIPSSGEKILSENVETEKGKTSPLHSRVLTSPLLKKPEPLPPISSTDDQVSQKLHHSNTETEQDSKDTKPSSPLTSLDRAPSIEDDEGLVEKSITPDVQMLPQSELPETDKETIDMKKDESPSVRNEVKGTGAEVKDVENQEARVDIKPPIIFVLGGPGCGKGTQCAKIVENYGFVHFSAGDLLRGEVAKGTETGKMIENIMNEGQLVPQEITIGLLKSAMLNLPDAKGFLIDGFPREIAQGVQFENEVKNCTALMMFDCEDETLISRLMKRAASSGRADDNEETIKKRLALFHEKTMPVIEYYNKKAMRINANRSIEEVYGDVKVHMDSIIGDKEASKEVEEETIKLAEEIVNVDLGVSRDFAKSALEGKEIIFVIGGPGCGKGTQCALIVQKFGHKHLSAGDLLRKEVAAKTEIGNSISECMEKGELVPRHLVIRLLMNAMVEDEDAQKFIIDGYPRELVQGEEFEKEIAECTRVLYFHCPSEIMVERLLKRGETSGRVDDNEETIKKRLVVFEEEVAPIVEYYKAKGKLSQISALGTPPEVFELVCKQLENSSENPKQNSNPEEASNSIMAGAKEALKDANIVFVLGGPGSGKGTQCAKIIDKYGFCHLSTGDLLREEVQSGSKRAEALKEIMGKGELVSQDTILELLCEAMIKRKDCKGFLIDGFPRDVPQGAKFEKEVGTCKFILFFDCSNACMVERLLGRAKTSGRVDDNEETIKKRLKTFEEQTLPVLDVYEKQGKVRKVNAERGVDEIFQDVTVALDALF